MKTKNIGFSRRKALKAIGAGIATATFLPACSSEKEVVHVPMLDSAGIVGVDGKKVLPWANWSGNQNCQPNNRPMPSNETEVADIIKQAKTVRCVGSGHSFSSLVPTDQTLLSLSRFSGVNNIDVANKQATIGGGNFLLQVGDPLWNKGLALRNMPDINTQTLAGSIATSTHGTGKSFGSLSSDVVAMKIVNGEGDVVQCSASENADLFNAARTNLGTLGAVTEITMQLQDRFKLEERKWFVEAEQGFAEIEKMRDESRHFELYAFPHADYLMFITINQTDEFNKGADEPESDGALLELKEWSEKLPWLKSYLLNSALSDEVGKTSVRRDRSYRIYGNLRDIRFNEMEYSIPAEHGPACLQEILATIKKQDINVVFPIEYRYIQADDIWLSPFYQRDSCAISCHNFHDRDYKKYFALLEPIFLKYDGRPHWGKIHTLNKSQLMEKYQNWDNFQKVRQAMDPQNKFLNEFGKQFFA